MLVVIEIEIHFDVINMKKIVHTVVRVLKFNTGHRTIPWDSLW